MKSAAPTGRPYVLINMAMTADGKIATANRRLASFGSQRDQQHLYELRATVDAVMSGARTVDGEPVDLGPGPPPYRRQRLARGLAEYNLRVVVSGSASLQPTAGIFRHRFSPILLLTTRRAPAARLAALRPLAAAVHVCGDRSLDFRAALRWLHEHWHVRRLLCEGGGALNFAMIEANLVDEIHLTICPRIFGGAAAPTIADGAGFARLAEAARFQWVRTRHVGDEMFAVLRRS